jgi:alpha-galactosidase
VVVNRGDRPIEWNGIRWDAHSLSFHPGPKGEYSVVRFTALVAGDYTIHAQFKGIDEKATTDVHVLRQGQSLFDAFILVHGFGRESTFDHETNLEKGETLDFVVGYGNGQYDYDSTGLKATVTGPDGVTHDAAKQTDDWRYGYLQPGEHPKASTFRAYDKEQTGGASEDQLLDLGNRQAWTWLVEHVDKLLTENGIDLYRQDFNIDPLPFWQGNDAPDRQGITENKHVVGYLAYWDELRRRHPNMLIDSCASGGRRNDLETMRRSVPLWRSDYAYEPIGHQCMTYGISMWLPFHGTGTVADEGAPYYGGGATPIHPYAFWSNAAPSLGSGIDIRQKGIDYPTLRRLFEEWRSIGPYYYGDFYPITPWTRQDDNWIAWQYNRPEHGDGVIQAFRRPKSADDSATLKLRGLHPKAHYRIEVIDGATLVEATTLTGKDLMQIGVTIKLSARPVAAVLRYSTVAG